MIGQVVRREHRDADVVLAREVRFEQRLQLTRFVDVALEEIAVPIVELARRRRRQASTGRSRRQVSGSVAVGVADGVRQPDETVVDLAEQLVARRPRDEHGHDDQHHSDERHAGDETGAQRHR